MEKPVFDKAYDPKAWEEKLYALWEKSGFFNPDICVKEGVTKKEAAPFSLLMPPPNVTGVLHLGHAMENALMDTMTRYKRMQGLRTLFLPGVDHAAIATQAKVEKLLIEKEGLKNPRQELGREKLLERIREFSEDSKISILKQIRAMGSSCDWSRLAYTFDEKRSLAVNTLFKKMYEDGLIYRGYRVVNWSINGQSTLSDDEVVYKEVPTKLYTFRYAKDFPIPIATTRPETKLGDMAVAVHPEDKRYQKYIGKTFTVDFGTGKPLSILVIGDSSVDKEFGTGAIGITPAHSITDFDMWTRQGKKDLFPVIDTQGKMTPLAGTSYAGLTREEAREEFVAWLRKENLLEKEEEIIHNVATSDRFGDIIEQLPLEQWFVSMEKKIPGREKSLKDLLNEAVTTGLNGDSDKKILLLPARFEKIYLQWTERLRDWCISRQIWWGHRIPAWYCLNCKAVSVDAQVKSRWFLVRHGETDGNKNRINQGHLDIPLNETGRKQGAGTAEKLKNKNVRLIISSDLGRCKETAQIIADTLDENITIEYDSALRERFYGDAQGLPYEETEKRFGHPYAKYESTPGNIESPKDLEERIARAITKHKELHGDKNVVIVGHGAALRMLMKRIRNLTFEEAKNSPRLENAEIVSLDILEAPCKKCGSDMFEQDPDTLDTWFSSGTWPLSTLGWPEETADLKTFLPTSWMQMGNEIFFLWLLRMVLITAYTRETIPFREVYMHGMLRDEKGQKFSKSLGNGIDPMDVINQYGTDALRIALLSGITPGNDMRFSMEKVEVSRNFVNKLWNMARYLATAVATEKIKWDTPLPSKLFPADEWILDRLEKKRERITSLLEKYSLSLAAEELRDFTWNEFADWYIEIHKIEKNDAVLVYVFNQLLILWHPFMPFVTEALYISLYPNEKHPLMVSIWRAADSPRISDKTKIENFLIILTLIQRIRNIRAIYHIDPKELLPLTFIEKTVKLESFEPMIKRLARVEKIFVTKNNDKPDGSIQVIGRPEFSAFIHLSGVIDIAAEKLRLEKEKENVIKYIEVLKERLSDTRFTEKAPGNIIEAQHNSLTEAETKLGVIVQSIQNLN